MCIPIRLEAPAGADRGAIRGRVRSALPRRTCDDLTRRETLAAGAEPVGHRAGRLGRYTRRYCFGFGVVGVVRPMTIGPPLPFFSFTNTL